ncbi:unnamed protein product [Effrenium voratum]|nr:unnamed protein product [Effrenium voratum]
MSKSSVTRELQTELEPALVRGVPLDLCMSGWAKHFVPPDPGMFKVDHSNYDLSKQTQYYDEFLSHDWETSRWYKLCTMLMIYNSRAAFFCSLVVSIGVGILRAARILPNALWVQLSVFAVFPLVLCFWQRIRSIFAKPAVVFLDKLCIAQHDEELKQKGIFGLAGFLDHSRQLTIFWSHRYFSRLWCTYEVGTFLRAKKQKPILVIPVKLAVILSLFSAAELVIMVGYFSSAYLNLDTEDTPNDVEQLLSFFLFFSLFYMPALPLLFYLGIGMMSDLKELPGQLREFRVQDAECFCCSHNHRHPDTGEVLLCDRELMFQMLKKWFGRAGDLHDEHLDVFNRLVHEDLAPRVLRSVGSDVLPFNYSMYMVVACTLPGLCTLIPTLAAGPPNSSFNVFQHGVWALREIMNWAFAGVIVLYALRLSTRGWLIAVRLAGRCSRHHQLICSLLMPMILTLTLSIQFFSFQLALSHSEQDSLLPAIPFVTWSLALYCFWTLTPTTSSGTGTSFVADSPIFKEEPRNKGDRADGNILKIACDDDAFSTFST